MKQLYAAWQDKQEKKKKNKEEEALYLTSFYKVRKEKQHELKITTYIMSN
jgi:hypothetical protein